MTNNIEFIQQNSPDGGFLQSEEWRRFQEAVGRRTFHVEMPGFWANSVEHQLPFAGKYLYVPRGPVMENDFRGGEHPFYELIGIAKKHKAGWLRFDPPNNKLLEIDRKLLRLKVAKAPHDMQPKQILMVDISGSDGEILSGMKPKTRYNIKLAERKGVKVLRIKSSSFKEDSDEIKKFCDLVKITAKRDGITPHPESYYRKMFETVAEDHIALYLAKYQGEIIAGNLIIFFGTVATYLHGASDNIHRNVMAPHLLQWQAMKDAKERGCKWYDLGGVNILKPEICNLKPEVRELKLKNENVTGYGLRVTGNWSGITKFKTGFAPNAEPVAFPGSYDIVINPWKYYMYKTVQYIKKNLKTKLKSLKHLLVLKAN